MKKVITSFFLVMFSFAFALPLPSQDEEVLLYPLGQSQFIETSCDGIENQVKNYYSLCGETKLEFDLFRALFELSVSSSSSKGQFAWS